MKLFRSVFILFLSLLIFVSNSVAQGTSFDILNQDFLQAVQKGNLEDVTSFLELGADINATDEVGRNALMLVGNISYENNRNRIKILELLIEKEYRCKYSR